MSRSAVAVDPLTGSQRVPLVVTSPPLSTPPITIDLLIQGFLANGLFVTDCCQKQVTRSTFEPNKYLKSEHQFLFVSGQLDGQVRDKPAFMVFRARNGTKAHNHQHLHAYVCVDCLPLFRHEHKIADSLDLKWHPFDEPEALSFSRWLWPRALITGVVAVAAGTGWYVVSRL